MSARADVRCAVLVALAVIAVLQASQALGDPLPEPPADADPNADYVTARDDSVDAGSLSVDYALSGRAGRAPGSSRSLQFRGDSVDAGLREGEAEPDAGGEVSSRAHGRVLRIGRITPAWGRGLAVGTPADPWTVRQRVGASPFAPRARGGEGVSCGWPTSGVESFIGRMGGREAMGLSAAHRGVRLSSVSARGRPHCVSVGFERDDRSVELALSGARRWRAEGVVMRSSRALDARLRAIAGDEAFLAPLAAARATPSRAAVAVLGAGQGAWRTTATLAGWRSIAHATGTRAAIETAWRDARRGAWSCGFEEQHGTRRASQSLTRIAGLRQGLWLEWRGETPLLALSVRGERWGSRPFARARVRETLAVGVEAPLPGEARLIVAHTVYRAHPGETVYVPERDSDRWVLRALSGAGDRTRATLRLPLAEGTLSGTLTLARARGTSKAQWAMQWSRRIRLRRAA